MSGEKNWRKWSVTCAVRPYNSTDPVTSKVFVVSALHQMQAHDQAGKAAQAEGLRMEHVITSDPIMS